MKKIFRVLFQRSDSTHSDSWVITILKSCFEGNMDELNQTLQKLNLDKSKSVLTPNLNHLRIVSQNFQFQSVYLSADFILADGMPVRSLARRVRSNRISRLSGVDLVQHLIKNDASFAVIGSSQKIVYTAMQKMGKSESKIPVFSDQIQVEMSKEVIDSIIDFISSVEKRFILLALTTEKQLRLTSEIFKINDSLPVIYVGVGGSFDIISGKFVRAPKFFQSIGCEWIWRAFQNPRTLLPRYFFDFIFLVRLVCQYFSNRIVEKK